MSLVWQPSKYDSTYQPARGPVLLLTCMDLRLLDEIVEFMDHDGQTNRYDHVILAGAALGATGANGHHEHWKMTFEEHLKIAWDLHHIKDVYILEHRDCGAYRAFLKNDDGDFDNTVKGQKAEKHCHRDYAKKLTKSVLGWAKKNKIELSVTSFLMDLRGNVKLLVETRQSPKVKKAQPKLKTKTKTKAKRKSIAK